MRKSAGYIVLFLIGICLSGFFPISYLSISSGEFYCVSRTETFSLRWRHSVEKQLWYEHYQRTDNQFILFESWLQTFGAGTPSSTPKTTQAPKGYIGYRHNVVLNELNWTVSPRMEGTVLFNNGTLPVYRFLPEYSVVSFKSEKSPLWFYLLRSACDV